MGRYPQMRRRALSAEALAVRRMRWARFETLPSPGEPRGRGARHLDGAPGVLPLHVRFGDPNATAPHAPTAAEKGGARSAKYVRH